jgi:hypothetical protein
LVLQVKHSAEDLDAGSTMILTLEDQSILDEKGNLVEEDGDTLVDSLITEERKKQRAKKASQKKGIPLFGEVSCTAPNFRSPKGNCYGCQI